MEPYPCAAPYQARQVCCKGKLIYVADEVAGAEDCLIALLQMPTVAQSSLRAVSGQCAVRPSLFHCRPHTWEESGPCAAWETPGVQACQRWA